MDPNSSYAPRKHLGWMENMWCLAKLLKVSWSYVIVKYCKTPYLLMYKQFIILCMYVYMVTPSHFPTSTSN